MKLRYTPEALRAAIKRVRPELAEVPPCRECGKVPTHGYSRFDSGEVQCIADRRNPCYSTRAPGAGEVGRA